MQALLFDMGRIELDFGRIKHEALDLAAALIRLHDGLEDGSPMAQRSTK